MSIDARLQLFLEELRAQCELYGSLEFTFDREYWDPLWQPWFIYVGENALHFTSTDISEEDLTILSNLAYIHELEAIKPLQDASDVKSGCFRLLI